MRTEQSVYETNLDNLINSLALKIDQLESKGYMDDQDEIELSALDRLMRDLDRLF